MKIRKSIRTVLDACKTNELALQRTKNKLMFELRAANESLNGYLPDVLLLYRQICHHPQKTQDIVTYLNNNCQLVSWELSYWRLRACIANKMWNQQLSDEFIMATNDRDLTFSQIQLIVQLLAGWHVEHKQPRDNLQGLVIEYMDGLPHKIFLKIEKTLSKVDKGELKELRKAMQKYREDNKQALEAWQLNKL